MKKWGGEGGEGEEEEKAPRSCGAFFLFSSLFFLQESNLKVKEMLLKKSEKLGSWVNP